MLLDKGAGDISFILENCTIDMMGDKEGLKNDAFLRINDLENKIIFENSEFITHNDNKYFSSLLVYSSEINRPYTRSLRIIRTKFALASDISIDLYGGNLIIYKSSFFARKHHCARILQVRITNAMF